MTTFRQALLASKQDAHDPHQWQDAAFDSDPEASFSCFDRMTQTALVTIQLRALLEEITNSASAEKSAVLGLDVRTGSAPRRVRELLGGIDSVSELPDIGSWRLSEDDERMAFILFEHRLALEKVLADLGDTHSPTSGETTPTASSHTMQRARKVEAGQGTELELLEERVKRWAAEDAGLYSRSADGGS